MKLQLALFLYTRINLRYPLFWIDNLVLNGYFENCVGAASSKW